MSYRHPIWPVLVFFTQFASAQSPTDVSARVEDLPSAEMLEFLSEWESLDDETWEILEHHALDDVSSLSDNSK